MKIKESNSVGGEFHTSRPANRDAKKASHTAVMISDVLLLFLYTQVTHQKTVASHPRI